MADYPNARDCEHGRLRRSCERCADAFLIAELSARLAEVEQALRTVLDAADAADAAMFDDPVGDDYTMRVVEREAAEALARAVLDKGEPDGR